MTDTKIKLLNQPGDYYFCSLCAAWHRCTNDPSSTGNQHLSHLDENETDSPTSKYFFCSLCGKWHTDARKDHIQYRLHIQHFIRRKRISFMPVQVISLSQKQTCELISSERQSKALVVVEVKKLNCEVTAAYIDPDWIKDENISIKGINLLSCLYSP